MHPLLTALMCQLFYRLSSLKHVSFWTLFQSIDPLIHVVTAVTHPLSCNF